MEARIVELSGQKLIGMRRNVSLSDGSIPALWASYMPRKKEILTTDSESLFSVNTYASTEAFLSLKPTSVFEKWVTLAVDSETPVPAGMESLTIPAGQYAVFTHRGDLAEFGRTMYRIITEWLPSSGYVLDHRPHVEVLGKKYKHNHPDSEEAIWLPVRLIDR
ncbi:MAG: GyrI-like domain-containing protein [Ferruginibacter sp.]